MKAHFAESQREAYQDSMKAHVIEMMGRKAWLRLVGVFGGEMLRVPRNADLIQPGHRLVSALGLHDALAFQEQFAGERQYIPLPIECRFDRYLEAIEEGLTNVEIAKRFGISERGVRMALGRAGVENPNRSEAFISPLDPEEVALRLTAYKRYLEGRFSTLEAAANTLGISVAALSHTAAKHGLSRKHAMPAVSNGGLTGLGRPSGALPNPDNENASTAR